jgi:REP element-mobilizing transposase RayT
MEIFRDDGDRVHFLTLFEKYSIRAAIRCYAWSLMPNHFHLVVRSSDRPLSSLMKPLNARYATYFNRKIQRRGYLFQDRFKSVATQDQLYLEEMIRYVHLNPVRAGICRNLDALDTYAWCGHAALMGTRSNRFQDTAAVLHRFGREASDARANYREFLQNGIDRTENAFVSQLRVSSSGSNNRKEPAMWVIGDAEFVRKAIRSDKERRLRVARYAREGWDIERVCKLVAARLDLDPGSVLERGRGDCRSAARKIVAHIAHRHFEFPVSAVARYFGVGQPAVSAMIHQGKSMAEELRLKLND